MKLRGLMPSLDSSTRWSSIGCSTHRALRIKVRSQIFLFQYRLDIVKHHLSDDEWDPLEQIHAGLECFRNAHFESKVTQVRAIMARFGRLYRYLRSCWRLVKMIENSDKI